MPGSKGEAKRRVWGWNRLILWANLVVLLLFAAGFLARFIHPRHGWIFQFVAVLIPLLVSLVTVFGAYAAVTRNWPMVLLNICALLFAVARQTPAQREGGVIQSSTEPLTVISFNAKSREGGGQEEMIRLLRTRQPDIIAIQESAVTVYDDSAGVGSERHLFPLIRQYGVAVPRFVESNDLRKIHQPIFSKHDPLEIDQTPIRRRTESRYGGVVTITRATYRWGDREFAVYNIHLTSFGVRDLQNAPRAVFYSPAHWWNKFRTFAEDIKTRAVEAERIKEILDAETLPFLVCGDFNSTPGNWVFRHLARGLQDSHHAAGRGTGATFHSRIPVVRIDYILASAEWYILDSEVIDIGFSDHRPVLSRLTLPSAIQ